MIAKPSAGLALMRRHQRLDHGPELVRNHTHSRHRPILAGQYLKIWETRPSTAAVDRIADAGVSACTRHLVAAVAMARLFSL